MLDQNALFRGGSNESKTLNKLYQISINKILNNLSDDQWCRLETYDVIISDWLSDGKESNYEEFKYRIIDSESIDKALLEIINNDLPQSELIYSMSLRLEDYILEDRYKRFLK